MACTNFPQKAFLYFEVYLSQCLHDVRGIDISWNKDKKDKTM
jgi:hypothetical protein